MTQEQQENVLNEITRKIDEMYTIIVGNKWDSNSGIIKKLEHIDSTIELHGDRIDVLERESIRAKAYIAAFIAIGGVIGMIIKAIYDHYSQK